MTRCVLNFLKRIASGAMLVLSGVMAVSPVAAVQAPSVSIEPQNCITSECHAEIDTHNVIHGPVVARSCDACHVLVSAEHHTFELARQKAELCTYCHDFRTGMLPVIHAPVTMGECLGCHNPHGGTDHSLSREGTIAETCNRCHDPASRGDLFQHHPLAEGQCTSCHRPHASRYPMLLDAVGTRLCLSCHDQFEHELQGVKFKHKALDSGCTQCHDAHGSNYPMAIRQPLADLCLSCHESVKRDTEAGHRHPAVLGNRACLTCHTAHGGDLSSLLYDLPVKVCMNCHDKTIESANGTTVRDLSEINDPERSTHTPIRDGQCGGCHTIHGGDDALLLRERKSPEIYQRYSLDNYALCFDCHDHALADAPRGTTQTEFRNGDINLHYVHVVQDEYGRNCSVCHGIHTGAYVPLIRDKVTYGNWMLSIQFTKTDSGGQCTTGCHPPFSYDRLEPVPSESTFLPRPHVPHADKDQPVRVNLTAVDSNGAEVRVPAINRPSVLVLLRAEDVEKVQVLKSIAASDESSTQSQVVVVVCGENTGERIETLSKESPADWHFVSDMDCELPEQLGVGTWPATLVVRADGVLLAHLHGNPPMLAMTLAAYEEYATGAIDQQALGEQLARHGVVADGQEQRAAWHLQMGRKLMALKQYEQAQDMFSDGLKASPDDSALKVNQIRALLELDQPAQALEKLDHLPSGALETWEAALLRGRVHAELGQWNQTRDFALEALKLKPDLSEAHYLLGRVAESERDWEKAAKEYHAAIEK